MKRATFAALTFVVVTQAAAQVPASAPPSTAIPAAYGVPVSVDEAMALIEKGMKLAAARKFKMAFAVVEPSGELVAFARMDDVVYASALIAQQKARSAARFRLPTSEFENRVIAGRTVLLSSDEVVPLAGGIPIVVDGRVVGALGVSGGSAADDAAVARDALFQQ
ncbi:heme-binding protein [Novosphingobium sp. CCH12-A3]|uniref:GlcG/HbpS family heme-binding protein n=1 Tax=Novosphingobium sp. CCH12-A3 TaxID=1768752 RepID=UPI000782A58B|nr:heme-binding protein [Novosphingobium sp. CCH12-A3]